MKRVAIYCRVSTEEQKKGQNIDQQIDELKKFVEEKGWVIVDIYADDGWSGALARPELDRLRDDSKTGKFETVVFNDVDRLARSIELQAVVLRDLKNSSVEIIFRKLPQDTGPTSNLMINILGSFAQFERELIADRTRRGRLHRARKGLLVGHEAPYGYRYVRPDHEKDDRWFELNPNEAKVVKMIFNWLAYDQSSLRGLIKRLYENKIPTREGNPVWASSTLARLVRSEVYIGKAHYNKTVSLVPKNPSKINGNGQYKKVEKSSRAYKPREEWLPIEVPSVIDEETFRLAQLQLARNKAIANRELRYQYLLRGLILCSCGSRFAGDGAQRGHVYYRCTNRLRKFPFKKDCSQGVINADKFEPKVWSKVSRLFSDLEFLQAQVSKFFDDQHKETAKSPINTVEIEKQLKELSIEEKRWMDAYQASVIPLEKLDERLKDIEATRSSLKIEIGKVENQLNRTFERPSEQDIEKWCDEIRELLPELSFEDREIFLHDVLKDILITDKRAKVRGIIPIGKSLQKENVSQSNFSGGDRSGRRSDNSRSGYKWAISPILYNRRPARQSGGGSQRKSQNCHQKHRL